MRMFLGTATVPVLQPLFLKPQSDTVLMLDTIYQEGFGIEPVHATPERTAVKQCRSAMPRSKSFMVPPFGYSSLVAQIKLALPSSQLPRPTQRLEVELRRRQG